MRRLTAWITAASRSLALPFTVVVALLPATAPVEAASYSVAPDGTGDFPTIQEAIDHAVSGDVVELLDGVFVGDGNRDIDFQGKAIALRSEGEIPEACIMDCQSLGRGFRLHLAEGLNTVIEGLTVQNGSSDDLGGGGLLCESTSPTIRNCRFVNNRTSGNGGGIACQGNSDPQVSDCEFLSNSAGYRGGGLRAMDLSGPILERCLFRDNSAPEHGGGVNSAAAGRFVECSFQSNSSAYGGGLSIAGGGVTIISCTFRGNAAIQGSGVYCYANGSASLAQTVVAFGSGGPGVWPNTDDGGSASLTCSDIFGNAGGDWVGSISGQLGMNGNFSEDPRFCPSSLNVSTESPCLPHNSPCQELVGSHSWACGASEGACCFKDGSCQISSEPDCETSSGNYLGDYVLCVPSPCPVPSACCNVLTCQCVLVINAGECEQRGVEFVFQGLNTTCDPSPCGGLGACCLPDGCIVVSCSDCGIAGGGFLGPATPCDPDMCATSGLPVESGASAAAILKQPLPNPTAGEISLEMQVSYPTRVRLEAVDVRGTIIAELFDDQVTVGNHVFEWSPMARDGRPLPVGVYWMRLSTGQEQSSQRLVVIR